MILLLCRHHHSGNLQLQVSRMIYFRLREYDPRRTDHPRGVMRPSLASTTPAKHGGRRECRMPGAPPAALALAENNRRNHYRFAETPAFPAQWFSRLIRALAGVPVC